MDMWKYYDVTHREHTIMNPTGEEKLRELIALLRLDANDSAIDIGCGKGEFLLHLARAYGVKGIGIERSPYTFAEAKERVARLAPDADIAVLEMDGADYRPEAPHTFALAACLGASWIFGGHGGTLDALIRLTAPGGWIIAGEPYWLQEPTQEYLEDSGERKEDFGTHASNVEAGERRGLVLTYTFVSNKDEWDRYQGLQWVAADRYARAHPDDPDLPALLDRLAKEKRAYLKWGRDTLGWAIYVFRRVR
ncbi:MAG: methyltransferase domain-containing protein [Candidatus Eisenbacteria bacterium]|nr:methyltransferase domain-containing protein [Candidatus Latescibacterota bacterium]MBD3302155.1 methyltransferase domain-containing protein [Candidatus Eisenbacteria bacterium]